MNATSNNEEEITSQIHTDLTWKTSQTTRGKNHERQIAKLHYIGVFTQRRGDFIDATHPQNGGHKGNRRARSNQIRIGDPRSSGIRAGSSGLVLDQLPQSPHEVPEASRR